MTEKNKTVRSFNFGGGRIRVVMAKGSPWFVAKDVGDVLGLDSDSGHFLDTVNDEDRRSIPVTDKTGREQEFNVINKTGLYDLIINSRKAKAKKFREWISSEVLPDLYENEPKPILNDIDKGFKS
jgi:prophage antirepressor-like protein